MRHFVRSERITHAQAAALGITRCLCGCPVDRHFRLPVKQPCKECKCVNLKRRVPEVNDETP